MNLSAYADGNKSEIHHKLLKSNFIISTKPWRMNSPFCFHNVDIYILQEQKQSRLETKFSNWTNTKRNFVWKQPEWIYALLSPFIESPIHILDKDVINGSKSNEKEISLENQHFLQQFKYTVVYQIEF